MSANNRAAARTAAMMAYVKASSITRRSAGASKETAVVSPRARAYAHAPGKPTTIVSSAANPRVEKVEKVKKKRPSSVVTKAQGKELRRLYRYYSHDDDDDVRRKARLSAAKAVGVLPSTVAVKFGEYHRSVKKAATKAEKKRLAATTASK